MKFWEIREEDDMRRDRRGDMYGRRSGEGMRGYKDSSKSDYDCGYEDGYRDAMKEARSYYGERRGM